MIRLKCDSTSVCRMTRRKAFRLMTGGFAGGLLSRLCGRPRCRKSEDSTQKSCRVEEAPPDSEIIEAAYRLGYQYEKEHGGLAAKWTAEILLEEFRDADLP